MVLDRDFLVHAAAGTCGGVAGVYVGAPLDTIKVLLQTRSTYSGKCHVLGGRRGWVLAALTHHTSCCLDLIGRLTSQPTPPRTHTYAHSGVLDCVRSVVRSQGPRALYKGALTNALGQIPNNAIVFGSYGSTLAWLARTFPSPPPEPSNSGGDGGDYWNVFLAGCFAGFLQCLALAPFEAVKLKQQTTDWRPGVPRVGLRECARELVASKGVSGGLYRGFWSLVWRYVYVVGVMYEMGPSFESWLDATSIHIHSIPSKFGEETRPPTGSTLSSTRGSRTFRPRPAPATQ